MIRFSVKDTGIGISQADLGKLFKSFSQVTLRFSCVLLLLLVFCEG
jgi:signal transduction histidine kinase